MHVRVAFVDLGTNNQLWLPKDARDINWASFLFNRISYLPGITAVVVSGERRNDYLDQRS